MDLNLYKLEKLKITAYEDEERTSVKGSFDVMFNPESYVVSYQNAYAKTQGMGSNGSRSRFSKNKDAVISFKFIFDGTGVSDVGIAGLAKAKDVYKEVQRFIQLAVTINGKIHEPNFLKIGWGDLDFKCRLENLQIFYTLFDHTGKPLRAELDTTFTGDLAVSERLKSVNLTSPDLTHKRVVRAHDTLPLLCEEIYGSGLYYLRVAHANHLDNFRELVPGQELFFPPIEK